MWTEIVGAKAWFKIAKIPKKPKACVWFLISVFSAISVPAETKKKENAHPWKNLKTKYEIYIESNNIKHKLVAERTSAPKASKYFLLYLSPRIPEIGVKSSVLIPAIDITNPMSNSVPPSERTLIGSIKKAW